MSGQSVVSLKSTINGKEVVAEIEPRTLLVDFLRHQLNLTGTKRSCDMQVCGSCTVLVDGLPVSSCCTLAYEIHNREVLTIEGMARNGELHPIQHAFLEEYGLQCGFCTPGMVLTTLALLNENPEPNEAEIKAHLSGNLCRCTGYFPIIRAVQRAAEKISQKGSPINA
jgi:aerobic-type carbon monoxide dehydrogenase small subunit (CoxS/CutS family)